jgi:hypothetical protein
MAFQRVSPAPGSGAGKGGEMASVAWRCQGSKQKRLFVTISKGMTERLPWARDKGNVTAEYCPDTNRLRLAPSASEVGAVFRLHAVGREHKEAHSTLMLGMPMPHIAQTMATMRAETVVHEVEDGALILTLPVWASDRAKVRAREAAERVRGGFRLGSAA